MVICMVDAVLNPIKLAKQGTGALLANVGYMIFSVAMLLRLMTTKLTNVSMDVDATKQQLKVAPHLLECQASSDLDDNEGIVCYSNY